MSLFEALVLGITQGLAEFLPISSSGHLILVPWLFGWDTFDGDPGLKKAFDVALHIGTLVAVVAYFRADLVTYVRDGLKALAAPKRATPEGRLAWLLVLSSVPAAFVGVLFEGFIDNELGAVWLIATLLIVFGIVLWLVDRSFEGTRTMADYGVRHALLVGCGQVLALSPGVSRSGATMTVGRALGFSRDAAARISFLMSLPVITGAIVVKSADLLDAGLGELWAPLLVGITASGVSGWLAVWGTLRLVRTRSFSPFVIWRVGMGLLVLGLLATGVR